MRGPAIASYDTEVRQMEEQAAQSAQGEAQSSEVAKGVKQSRQAMRFEFEEDGDAVARCRLAAPLSRYLFFLRGRRRGRYMPRVSVRVMRRRAFFVMLVRYAADSERKRVDMLVCEVLVPRKREMPEAR